MEERTCPKLKDCYQKNNLRFVPTKKSEREFLKREEASTFLRTVEADDNDGKENSENILKRFLFASNLAEETKENRDEAFEGSFFFTAIFLIISLSIFFFSLRRILRKIHVWFRGSSNICKILSSTKR